MDQLIKVDLKGPKFITITYKAVQTGLRISSFPLTLNIRGIKIGSNAFPQLQVNSDTLPLYMNPIGPGSEFEILDSEGHSLYTWRLQDDGRSTQPEPQVTSTPGEPTENGSNAQVHAADSPSGADEPQPTPTPSKPARNRKSLRLLEKERPKEKSSLLKEERELLSFVLSKLFAQMCNYFRLLFWKPVHPTKETNVPIYRRIITQPMSLRYMEYKLKEQNYSSPEEFLDDFDLMIISTELFSGRNHSVTLMSRRVEDAFIALMSGGSQCPKLECGERHCRDCWKLGKEDKAGAGEQENKAGRGENENKAGKGEKRRAAAEPSRSDRAAKRKTFRMEPEKHDQHLEEVGL